MFNALKYTEILEKAGFTREQAEQTLKVYMEVMEFNLASKHDIERVEGEIKKLETTMQSEVKRLETTMQSEVRRLETQMDQFKMELVFQIKELESRMTIKLGSLMVICISVMTAIFKFA